MVRVRTGHVLMAAALFLWRHKSDLRRAAMIPAALMLLVSLIADAKGSRSLGASLLLLYLGTFVAFFWMRRILRSPGTPSQANGTFVGVDGMLIRGNNLQRLLAFQWRLCLVGIVIYLAGTALGKLVPVQDIGYRGSLFYYACVAAFVASPLIVRWFLAIPAGVAGYPYSGLFDAWYMSRGHTFDLLRLFLALLLISVAAMMGVDSLQGLAAGYDPRGEGSLMAAISYFVAHLLMTACAYLLIAFWSSAASICCYLLCSQIGDYVVARPEFDRAGAE